MIVFFEVPLILILVILMGLIGIGVQIASKVVFWIFVIIFALYWIAFSIGLVSSAIIKDSIMQIMLSIAICIWGFLITLFLIKTFYRVDGGSKTLLAILAGLIIAQIIILLVTFSSEKSKLVGFVCMLFPLALSVICCMWTIGYELSYPIKHSFNNVAYYECTELKVESMTGKSFRVNDISEMEEIIKNYVPARLNGDIYDTYGTDVTKISEDHIIGTYDVGTKLQPSGKLNVDLEGPVWEIHRNDIWYAVKAEDGHSGYIPSTGIEVVYKRNSSYVEEKQSERIEDSWYHYFPTSVLNFCESYFERHPHQFKCNFAD